MTDINLHSTPSGSERTPPGPDEAIVELIELLFFAYRDFVSEPDEILKQYGFGRAHHRVIHFVGRHPGIRVAELLDILRITKQSLGRVLRELIEAGHVHQAAGAADRRQRLLYLTPQGEELHRQLMGPQVARVRAAIEAVGSDGGAASREVLFRLVDSDDHAHVLGLFDRAVERSA